MPRPVRRHTPTYADGRPVKITMAKMREMGVHGALVYCADYRCGIFFVEGGDHALRTTRDASTIDAALYQLKIEIPDDVVASAWLTKRGKQAR